MEHFIYQTTNLINGYIYLGAHSGSKTDEYLGSGKWLKAAIKKYGVENFKRTILEEFDNAEAMYLREEQIVDREFIARGDTYNLKIGGKGGWKHLAGTKCLSNAKGEKIRVMRGDAVVGYHGNTKSLKYFNDGITTFRIKDGDIIPPNAKPGRAWKAGGRKWFNDGYSSFFVEPSKATGLIEGRLSFKNEHMKNTKYYNNGKQSLRLKPDDPRVKGLFEGRLSRQISR